MHFVTRAAACVPLLLGAACSSFAPAALPPGSSIADARAVFAGPAAEFALPEGGKRLEFRRGRQTWMLDFDAAGTLTKSEQVLDEAHFATVGPGLSADEVRMRIGAPVETFPVGWQRLVVWNYRWWQGDCVWYQVSISRDTGLVTDAGYGSDPACSRGSSRD